MSEPTVRMPLSKCASCGAEVRARRGGAPPDPMRHRVGCPLDGGRACEWCHGPIKRNAPITKKTCGDRCRAYKHRWEEKIGRIHDRGRGGTNARSGLSVPYRKAVDVLAEWLYRAYPVSRDDSREQERRATAHREAELVLKAALPERQRQRLEARNG